MDDLKAIAVDLGFANVRTYNAIGNLLYSSDLTEGEVKALLEARLAEHMRAEVPVMVRTASELQRIVSGYPFTADPGNRVAAIFLAQAPPADTAESVRNVADERIALGDREVYVAYGA